MKSGRRQQGMVLIAVLLALVITLLAGMGVMRAVRNANVMAGNFSFRQIAVQASDRALENAMSEIANRIAGGSGNTGASRYLATIGAANSLGVPTAIDWTTVSCTDEKGAVLADCATDNGGYRVQYVVERRCLSNPDLSLVTQIRAQCEYEPRATSISPATISLRYRVLVRVRGPRGTENWFEAMVSGPATT